jgi:hypothetical protein
MSDFADGWDAALKSKVVTEMAAVLELTQAMLLNKIQPPPSDTRWAIIADCLTAYRAAIGTEGER